MSTHQSAKPAFDNRRSALQTAAVCGAVAIGIGALACTSATSPSVCSKQELRVQQGQQPAARVSAALTVTVQLICTGNGSPSPIPNATLDFTPTGGGTVSKAQDLTTAQGTAGTIWTLGPSVGTETLSITVGALDSMINTTVYGVFTITAGDHASGMVGQPLPPLQVSYVDGNTVGIPNQQIDWTVVDGGGTVSAPTSLTNGSGDATIVWTLGSVLGTQAVTATVHLANGLGPIQGFIANGTP